MRNFKETFFKEQFSEFRLRREDESKLIKLCLGIIPIVTTVTIAFANLFNAQLFLAWSVFSSFLILGTHKRVSDMIISRHSIYEKIGQTIVRICKSEGLFKALNETSSLSGSILSKEFEKLGSGEGYKESLQILSFISYSAALFFPVFAIINLVVGNVKL